MDDLIRRKYILDALDVFNDKKHGNNHFLNGIETARSIVKDAPAAEATVDWISVEDRLPDVGTRNIVARYDYVTNTQFWDLLWYDGFWWNRLIKGDFAVTHWMPLPEPPEGE